MGFSFVARRNRNSLTHAQGLAMANRPFIKRDKRPLLVCSLSDPAPADLQVTIRHAIYDGADGFLLHMERLFPECRDRESLAQIFSFMEGLPVMTLNYAYDGHTTADEMMALQTVAIEAGASCIDLPADMYAESKGYYSDQPEAVEMQMDFIRRVHEKGAQVLCSYHQFQAYCASDIMIERAKNMAARGADIVKIAMHIEREDQLPDALMTTIRLNRELDKPFLHILFGGLGKCHRALAPTLGSCMVLCVQQYTVAGHKDKPLLRATRDLYNNLDFEGREA
jgi:hypothetical protein